MANHAYLRVWTRDFSLETMLPNSRGPDDRTAFGHQNTFSELIVQPGRNGDTVASGFASLKTDLRKLPRWRSST